MVTKVYQLRFKRRAVFYTTYFGVGITLDFMHSTSDDDHGQLATSDKFVQDAIEHDVRFGSEFFLLDTLGKDDVPEEDNVETTSTNNKKPKKNAPKKVVVSDVTNINDAYDYFAAHGVVLTTLDELKAQIAKENVEFPNLNI